VTRSIFVKCAALVWIIFAFSSPSRTENKIDIEGQYKCKGNDIDGKEYTGTVEIRKRGETYTLKWTLAGGIEYEGVGLRTDNMLSVSWVSVVNSGVLVYQIEKGPKLTGRWSQLGAMPTVQKEVLSFEK